MDIVFSETINGLSTLNTYHLQVLLIISTVIYKCIITSETDFLIVSGHIQSKEIVILVLSNTINAKFSELRKHFFLFKCYKFILVNYEFHIFYLFLLKSRR